MSATPFNWPVLIAEIIDEASGIPPDVFFQIMEDDQVQEVKAHKMVLAMVSPMFRKMFYTSDVGDKTAKEIKIKETTKAAFEVMLDAIYNIRSLEENLKDKSVHEVFGVINLVERYQISELQEVVKTYISNYPVTDNTVIQIAADATEYTNLFHEEAQHILIACTKFLQPKLSDAKSIFSYAAEINHQKEVFTILLALMNDLPPTEPKLCQNCKYQHCQNGMGINQEDFKVGMTVTNNRSNLYWGESFYGTGKITKVDNITVNMEIITNGDNRQFRSGGHYNKNYNGIPAFAFSCN